MTALLISLPAIISAALTLLGGALVASNSDIGRDILIWGISCIANFISPIVTGIGLWVKGILFETVNEVFLGFMKFVPKMYYFFTLFGVRGNNASSLGFINVAQTTFRALAAAGAVFLFIYSLYALVVSGVRQTETIGKLVARFLLAIFLIIYSYQIVILTGNVISSTNSIWMGTKNAGSIAEAEAQAGTYQYALRLDEDGQFYDCFNEAFIFYAIDAVKSIGEDFAHLDKLDEYKGKATHDIIAVQIAENAKLANTLFKNQERDIAEIIKQYDVNKMKGYDRSKTYYIQRLMSVEKESLTGTIAFNQLYMFNEYIAPLAWNTKGSGNLKSWLSTAKNVQKNAKVDIYKYYYLQSQDPNEGFVDTVYEDEGEDVVYDKGFWDALDSLEGRSKKTKQVLLMDLSKIPKNLQTKEKYPNYTQTYRDAVKSMAQMTTVAVCCYNILNIMVMIIVIISFIRIYFLMLQRYFVWCVNVLFAPFFFAGIVTKNGSKITGEYIRGLLTQEAIMVISLWACRIAFEAGNKIPYDYTSLAGMLLYAGIMLSISQIPMALESYFKGIGLSAVDMTQNLGSSVIRAVSNLPMTMSTLASTGAMVASTSIHAVAAPGQFVSNRLRTIGAEVSSFTKSHASVPFGFGAGDGVGINEAFEDKYSRIGGKAARVAGISGFGPDNDAVAGPSASPAGNRNENAFNSGHGAEKQGIRQRAKDIASGTFDMGEEAKNKALVKAGNIVGGKQSGWEYGGPSRTLSGKLGLRTLDLGGYDAYSAFAEKGMSPEQVRQAEKTFIWEAGKKAGIASYMADGRKQYITFTASMPATNATVFQGGSKGYIQFSNRVRGENRDSLVSGWNSSVTGMTTDANGRALAAPFKMEVDMPSFMARNNISSIPGTNGIDKVYAVTGRDGSINGAIFVKEGRATGELADSTSPRYNIPGSIFVSARDGSKPLSYISHEDMLDKAISRNLGNTADGGPGYSDLSGIREMFSNGNVRLGDKTQAISTIADTLLKDNPSFIQAAGKPLQEMSIDAKKSNLHKIRLVGDDGTRYEVFDQLTLSHMKNVEGSHVKMFGDGLYVRELPSGMPIIYEKAGEDTAEVVNSELKEMLGVTHVDNEMIEKAQKGKVVYSDREQTEQLGIEYRARTEYGVKSIIYMPKYSHEQLPSYMEPVRDTTTDKQAGAYVESTPLKKMAEESFNRRSSEAGVQVDVKAEFSGRDVRQKVRKELLDTPAFEGATGYRFVDCNFKGIKEVMGGSRNAELFYTPDKKAYVYANPAGYLSLERNNMIRQDSIAVKVGRIWIVRMANLDRQ